MRYISVVDYNRRMTTYTIDTAAAIRKLKDAQCDEPLAEAIVDIVASRQDELATKVDLELVEERLSGRVEVIKNYLLFRLVLAQVATAALLFLLIKFFG